MKLVTLSQIVSLAAQRRTSTTASKPSEPSPAASPSPAPSPSPASTPAPSTPAAVAPAKEKARHIRSSSGDDAKTHECLLSGAADAEIARKARLEHTDEFRCAPTRGVDAARLLHFTRRAMYSKAALLGANAIIEERWTCTIYAPRKSRIRGTRDIRVVIHYTGVAASCSSPDPLQPVALHEAKSLPGGLMTILERK